MLLQHTHAMSYHRKATQSDAAWSRFWEGSFSDSWFDYQRSSALRVLRCCEQAPSVDDPDSVMLNNTGRLNGTSKSAAVAAHTHAMHTHAMHTLATAAKFYTRRNAIIRQVAKYVVSGSRFSLGWTLTRGPSTASISGSVTHAGPDGTA